MYEARQNKEKVSRRIDVCKNKSTQMLVLQRAKIPSDFEILVDKTHTLKNKIESLGGSLDIPLNDYIKNADVWANETKNAAGRKYIECTVALNEYSRARTNNIPNYEINFAPSANANPDIKSQSSLGKTNYEIKNVNGQKGQISFNIREALEQLKKNSPSENNIAVINISEDCFLNVFTVTMGPFESLYDRVWESIYKTTKNILKSWDSNYSVILYYEDNEQAIFTGTKNSFLWGRSYFPANIPPLIIQS